MPPAILEAAEIGITHEADIAGVRTLDDHDVIFVEVFALVDEFHGMFPRIKAWVPEYHGTRRLSLPPSR
jgi:hypothetical protein